MVLGCGMKFVKYTLFVLTFLFWLGGAALLGIGIWLRVDRSILTFFKVVTTTTGTTTSDPVWDGAAYFIIAIGAVVFLISFCGCCGACTENRCLLITYSVLVAVMLCCEVAAAILAGVYYQKLDDAARKNLQTVLQQQYNSNDTTSDSISDGWSFVQFKLECCGVEGPQDYKNNAYQKTTVPPTCCTVKNKNDYKSPDNNNYVACNNEYNIFDPKANTIPYPNLYTKGCYNKLKDYIQMYANIIIGVCAGVAALQLILVIFAACLAHRLLDEKMVYA